MNHELKQLLITFIFFLATVSVIWIGATITASDIAVRNDCYKQGVAGLPQGVDQTLLQTQSNAYKDCLSANINK